ncbi:MAG: nucleotidyltransferase domain-containing protein [Bacteroidetes bacterium]|nr:MAG: nucleotidyltransferase domain-containing protein [Bacteroidota bacterium]
MNDNFYISDTVKEQLRQHGVQLVYLFGSHAEGTNHPMSDVDIGVVMDYKSLENNANDLYINLFDIFTDVFPNESIDIVFLQRAGLELCFDVICHGKVLFESDANVRDSFEDRIQMLYMDYKPTLNMFDEQVLERIGKRL